MNSLGRQISGEDQLKSPTSNPLILGLQSSDIRPTLNEIQSSNNAEFQKPRHTGDGRHEDLTSDALASSRSQEYLCSPDLKIPRPRNAFILYRQHYQAQVVAQNPKLANPQVSKIIGDQWKNLTVEVKDFWKRLAEEEKQRHLRKYPGYRYQPRRAGKAIDTRSGLKTLSNHQSIQCAKADDGFAPTIVTSGLFNLNPVVKSRINCLEPRYCSVDQAKTTHGFAYCGEMERPKVNISQSPTEPQPKNLQIHHNYNNTDRLTSHLKGSKRRRVCEEISAVSAAPAKMTKINSSRDNKHLDSLALATEVGPKILGLKTRRLQEKVGPRGLQPQNQYQNSCEIHNQSLGSSVVPLETFKACLSHPLQSKASKIDSFQPLSKSIENCVIGIPAIRKIMILNTISPPPGSYIPNGPFQAVYGALIAVEGLDSCLRKHVGTFILNHIQSQPLFAVRSWSISDFMSLIPSVLEKNNLVLNNVASNPNSKIVSATTMAKESNNFGACLSAIGKLHEKSLEMKKFITTPPELSSIPDQIKGDPAKESKVIPIAIAPNGFSLTISDSLALLLPIEDNYSPIDHWHWVATLWRGIIGSNLFIFVTRVGRRELDIHENVEVCRECPVIIVRVLDGEDINDRTLRRLAFEVLEFVASIKNERSEQTPVSENST